VLLVLLLVPLVASSGQILQYEMWMRDAETATEQWVRGTGWKLDSVDQSGNEIVITVRGNDSSPPLAELKAAIREKVPEWVPVTLIEDAGEEREI
jgi:hypothetical protein